MKKVAHNPNEIIAVVDNNDNIIDKATRKKVHDKGLLHREVGVFLINSKSEILLQKRKDNNLWDTSCGGHFKFNQDYLESALREFHEELGINLKKSDLIEVDKIKTNSILYNNQFNKRFVKIYLVKKDISLKDFVIDKNELNEIKYFNPIEIKKLLTDDTKTTSSCKIIIKKYFLDKD
jgi:isopentenyldiphosphate isomerase